MRLARLIASETSNGTADGPLRAAGEAGAKVAELALGLLLAALEVLLTTRRLK